MSYKIYHIPGVKIGCSIQPEQRVKRQGYDIYEILEEHLSKSFASKRELELQEKYGYTKDCVSYDTFVNFKRQRQGGSIGGKKSIRILHSRPDYSKMASNAGKIGGKIRASQITFKELSDAGKKGGKKASENKETYFGGYVTCEYCNQTMNKGNYNRWHGNNCKNKK